jgi:hypothetical protein
MAQGSRPLRDDIIAHGRLILYWARILDDNQGKPKTLNGHRLVRELLDAEVPVTMSGAATEERCKPKLPR